MSIRKDNIIAAVDVWNKIYNELTRTDISGYDFEHNTVISDSYQGWFTRLSAAFKDLSTNIKLVGTDPSCLPQYTNYGQSITPTILSTAFNNLRNIQQGLNRTLEIAAKGRVSGNNKLTQDEINNSKQNPPPPERIGAVHKQQVAAYNFKNTLKSAYGLLSNIRNLILVSTKSEVSADINLVYDGHAAICAEHGYMHAITVPEVSQGQHQKFDHVRRWGNLRNKDGSFKTRFNKNNDKPGKIDGPIVGFITFYGPYAKIDISKLPPEISAEILNGVYPIYADKIHTEITGDRTGDGYGFLTLNRSDEYWKCIPATNDLDGHLGLEKLPNPKDKNYSLSYFANRMIYVKTGDGNPSDISSYTILSALPERRYPRDKSHPTPGWTTKNNGHQTGSATYYNVRCFIEKDTSTNPPTYYLYTKHLMTMFGDTALSCGAWDEDRITADIYYKGGFTIKLGEGESGDAEISDLIQLSSTILGFDTNVLQFGKNIEANNNAASTYLSNKGELSTAFINYNVPRDYKADKSMRFSRKNATDIDRLSDLNSYTKFFDSKDNESQYSSAVFNQETTGGIVNNYNQISGFPITSFAFTRNTNVVNIPTETELTSSQNTATVKDKLNKYFTASTNKNDGKIWSVDSNNISSQTKKQLIKAATVNSLFNDLYKIGKEITKNLYTIYAINAAMGKKIFLDDFSIWRNNKYVYFPTTLYFKSASFTLASSLITNSSGEYYDNLSSTYPGSVEDEKEQYYYVNELLKSFLVESGSSNMLDQDFYIGLVNNNWSNSVSANYRNISSSAGTGSYTRMVINKNINPSASTVLAPSESKWTHVDDITTKLTSYNTYPKGMVFEKRAPRFTVNGITADYSDIDHPKINSMIHLSDKGDKKVHSLDSFMGSQTQNQSYDISTLLNGLDSENLYPNTNYAITSDISNFILDISNDIVDQIESGTSIEDILSADVSCNIYLCSPNDTCAGFTVGNYYGNRNSVYPWMGKQISGSPGSTDPDLYENWPGYMTGDGPRDPDHSILTVSLNISKISDYLISISSEISNLFNS